MEMIKSKCIVWGTGSAYENRKGYLNQKFTQIVGFVDNNQEKWGTTLDGEIIVKPQDISKFEYEYILIMSRFGNEIREQLKLLGIEEKCIIDIYKIVDCPENNQRVHIANNYIQYEKGYKHGLEIGGGNNPMTLDKNIAICQVDYCKQNVADGFFSDLSMSLVNVDVVDDGERLDKFKDESQDFIIACHVIEHCINPIGAIRNFLRCLRSEGVLFLAIPDKRYTFDYERKITTLDHLLLDDMEPNISRDREHFPDQELDEQTLQNYRDGHIHFHVWDSNAWIEFISHLKEYLLIPFSIELVGNSNKCDGSEIICILKKQ